MPMFKKSRAVLLILVAAAIGGTMYGYYSEQETLALDAGTNMPPEPPPMQIRSKVCMVFSDNECAAIIAAALPCPVAKNH